jgi:crotonobetainyl-CoA:carnitine CoA-transferase CaiB-like acyl-CoA transferase
VTLLGGIQVLSIAINVPGPVAAKALCDMGATVVKVEPPSGDPLAAASPTWYGELHEGVEVHAVDLKSEGGRAQVHAWLDHTDLLITSTRHASLTRLGLSWHTVHAQYPRLCHVAVVGYPAPRHDEAGHDLTYQAESGLVVAPSMPRTLIADLAGAQRVVTVALALLLARERGGQAGYQEIALSDAAAMFAAPLRHGLTMSAGWLGGGTPAYGIYPARDGWIALAALEPHFRDALAKALDVDIDDREALSRVFAERSADEWQRWSIKHGVPLAAVR